MPKISRITMQMKRQDRYNIFLETAGKEAYGFSVEEETLISEGLTKGLDLSDADLHALKSRDSINRSYNMALHYLSYRMRATKEVKDYLIKKEVDPEHIDEIIQRLTHVKLLDDQAFSEAYVLTKKQTTSKGPRVIKQELFRKGIDQHVVDKAMDLYTQEEQVDMITQLIEKENNKQTKTSQKIVQQKLKQRLMQKGYASDAISIAFEGVEIEKDDDEEWEACVYQGEKILKRHERKHSGYMLKQKVKANLYQKGFDGSLIDRFVEEHVEGN